MATSRPLDEPGVIGAILVGGTSRRFEGRNKAAVIGPHVLDALRGALIDPVVAIGGEPGLLPVPTIADRYPGEGPLGAVATAATFARTGWILTATCDLPLIESVTLTALVDAIDPAARDTAVVASVNGDPQVSLGCWPAAWARPMHAAIRAGERRFRHLLTLGPVALVEVDARQLSDADDEATLADLWASQRDMADPDSPGA